MKEQMINEQNKLIELRNQLSRGEIRHRDISFEDLQRLRDLEEEECYRRE